MHKHGRAFLFLLGCLLSWAAASGQCPQPDFTAPDTVCVNETFSIDNISTGADRYEWDFCSGDLAEQPAVTDLVTLTGVSVPTNITTVFDGTQYFAFFFSRNNNLFFRLNFGSSPDNVPTVTRVGSLGAAIHLPEPLDFVQEGGNWYAFTANSLGNSNLIRLNFGADLTSTPSVTDLGNFGGRLTKPRGIAVKYDQGKWIAVVTNAGDNTLALLNFGSSINATPTAGDVVKTGRFPASNIELISTTVIHDCDQWVGLTVDNFGSKVFRVKFGTNLFSAPTVELLPVVLPSATGLFSIQLAYDGGYTALATGFSGALTSLKFGENLANGTPELMEWGNANVLSSLAGLSVVKRESSWSGYAISFSSNKVFKLSFPNACSAVPAASSLAAPPAMRFSSAGPQKIALTAYRGGMQKTLFRTVFVRPAPAVNFAAGGAPAAFTQMPASGSRFAEWSWNFGDGSSGTGSRVTHAFRADGNYNVTLTAKDVCGQVATITKKVGIVGNAALSCPRSAFSLPDTVCLNEPVRIVNTTIGATRYEWNFCSADLTQQPLISTGVTIPGASVTTDITTVFDGANWYGFASSRNNSKLFRLDFGPSLDNQPVVVDLGLPPAQLAYLEQMEFVREDGNWYALATHYLVNPGVSRLSFGNSLTNTPAVQKLSALNNIFKEPRGIEVVMDSARAAYTVLVTNYKDNTLAIIDFGNSIRNTPSAANAIVTNPLPGAGSGLLGISMIKECDQWVGIATSYENRVYALSFGNTLYNQPLVRDLSHLNSFSVGLGRVVVSKSAGKSLAHVMLFNGTLVRFDFGATGLMGTPRTTELGGITGDYLGIHLVQDGSRTEIWAMDWRANRIARFSFPGACDASVPFSRREVPGPVSFASAGWHKIELNAFNEDRSETRIDSVFVRFAVSADFTSARQCVGETTTFTNIVPAGTRIKTWQWDFGDGTASTEPTGRHAYSVASTYPVKLVIEDVCGNVFSIKKQVRIYENLRPGFTGLSTFCSNKPVAFADATPRGDDTAVAWQWDFGNGDAANGPGVSYSYPEAGNYTVTLTITGVSGCNTTVSKAVTVTPGVKVGFTENLPCIGNETQFINQSVVPVGTEVVSLRWDFGDNTSSTEPHPVHQYVTSGTYSVTLTVGNTAGCTTSHTKSITIRRMPRAAFEAGLACSGEETTFSDGSVPVEGGIAGWEWTFGDPDSGAGNVSTEQHPQHTFRNPGTYQVKLKIRTNYGCADSVVQTVLVKQAPRADFGYVLSCGSKTAAFQSKASATGGATILNWYWDFGDGVIATSAHPSHTYEQPGTYTVTHIVTSDARCQQTTRQTIQVTAPPQADFSLPETVCAGVPVTLQDKSTSSTGDPVVQWAWQVGTARFAGQSPAVTFPTGGEPVQVTLTVTSAAGCNSTVSGAVRVLATPKATFSHQASGTNPLSIDFSNASVEAAGFRWDFGDGQTSDLRSPRHVYAAGGVYVVRLTATNGEGCTDVLTQEVAVGGATNTFGLVLEEVTAQDAGSGKSLKIKLLNKGTKAVTALSFRVSDRSGPPLVQRWEGTLQAGKILAYTIALPAGAATTGDGVMCVQAEDETSGAISNRACTNLFNALSLLHPAPNPASTQFRLAFILPGPGEVKIELIDPLGRLVAALASRAYKAGYHEQLEQVGHLGNGLYFIRLTFGGQVRVKPLLIE